MTDQSLPPFVPDDLKQFGIKENVTGTLRTRPKKRKGRRVTVDEFNHLGNSFGTSLHHVEHENLLPGFKSMLLMKNL